MKCNIDARGKAIRLVMGLIMMVISVAVLLTMPSASWLILSAVAVLIGGAFAVFEGWAGWCAVRAMGFKTKI